MAIPHFTQAPSELELVIVEVPSPTGPFGAKGVGEPPVIPTAGAIANAIADAHRGQAHHTADDTAAHSREDGPAASLGRVDSSLAGLGH